MVSVDGARARSRPVSPTASSRVKGGRRGPRRAPSPGALRPVVRQAGASSAAERPEPVAAECPEPVAAERPELVPIPAKYKPKYCTVCQEVRKWGASHQSTTGHVVVDVSEAGSGRPGQILTDAVYRLDFGQMKGMTVEEIRAMKPSYLDWLAGTPSVLHYHPRLLDAWRSVKFCFL
jgi:hypothetical protein